MLSDARQTLPRLFSVCAIVLAWSHSAIAIEQAPVEPIQHLHYHFPMIAGFPVYNLQPVRLYFAPPIAVQSYGPVTVLRWGFFQRRLIPMTVLMPVQPWSGTPQPPQPSP